MAKIRRIQFRRVIAALCILALVIPFAPMNAVANDSANITDLPAVRVENKTVHRGQTFELNIWLDENPGLVAMILELDYNKSVMELVDVKRGDALSTHTFTTTNTETDEGFLIEPFQLLWDGTTQDHTTGLLATLTFESKITAPLGEYPVTLTYDAKNTNSEYGKPIEVEIDNGVVTLISGEFTVVYKNYDGTELQRSDYNDGDVPSYEGVLPVRSTDEMYSYTFSGWKGIVSNVEKEIWYVADYALTPQPYQVTFFVDGEYFHGDIYGYNEAIDLSYIPSQKNQSFSGWYLDEECTQKVTFQRMPAKDLQLYGYMIFNIREDEIPEITLTVDKIEEDIAFIDVNLTRNPSLAGLVLTLDYDRTALELIGLERGDALGSLQFSYTNVENGYDVDPFKLYWESAVNTYDTGTIVTLKFKMDQTVSAGMYDVTVTYDEKRDATYFTDDGQLWYTKLEIIGTNVPIGKIYHWYEETEDGIGIDVTTEEGQFPDTILEIKRITHLMTLSNQTVIAAAGLNMELKDIYSVRLLRNGTEVMPNGSITVKIELTEQQALCKTVMVFRVEDEQTLKHHESTVSDGFVIFQTEKLSDWAIVGNILGGEMITNDDHETDPIIGDNNAPTNTPILIIAPSLLAITTLGMALVLIFRLKKRNIDLMYNRDE